MSKNETTMTIAEAADHLGVATTTLRGMIARGELEATQTAPYQPLTLDRKVVVAFGKEFTPRKRGHPRINPEEDRVRAFGRATDEEVTRWQECADKKGLKMWPWLRRLANSAADKAGV